jgi:hypothetical protein
VTGGDEEWKMENTSVQVNLRRLLKPPYFGHGLQHLATYWETSMKDSHLILILPTIVP